jgi:sugar lactone lactonase YvrE
MECRSNAVKFLPLVALLAGLIGICGRSKNAQAALGNLFSAGTAGTILEFSPTGTQSVFASGLGSLSGLAFDRSGNLFVSDTQNKTILKFNSVGGKTSFAAGLSGPKGLAFDAAGNLFAADGTSILKFTPTGTKSTFASGLSQPLGLTFDISGNLYASDPSTRLIVKFTPAGGESSFGFISSPSTPNGIAFDSTGKMFASLDRPPAFSGASPTSSMDTFTSVGVELGAVFESYGTYTGLAFDSQGTLFYADAFNNKIMKTAGASVGSTFASGVGNPQAVAFQPVASLLGDFNRDGTVNAADYVTWRHNNGSPETYNIWRANYGTTAGTGTMSMTAVPEPSELVLLFMAIILMAGHARVAPSESA